MKLLKMCEFKLDWGTGSQPDNLLPNYLAPQWMGGGKIHTFYKQKYFCKSCGLRSIPPPSGSVGREGSA